MSCSCHVCGAPFTIGAGGVATHDGEGPDGIDHDADGDHVPYAMEEEQPRRNGAITQQHTMNQGVRMNPRMNLPCPESTDVLYSMSMQSQALAALEYAHELVLRAGRLLEQDFQWHRPDTGWKLPDDIAEQRVRALTAVRDLRASVHWTVNSLRKKPDEQNTKEVHCDQQT